MLNFTQEELRKKAKAIEDYLGSRVGYSSDRWPDNKVDCWLMEYLIFLKTEYYQNIPKIKRSKNRNFYNLFRFLKQ